MSEAIRNTEESTPYPSVAADNHIEPMVQMLKALAHPIRLRIVRLLADKSSFGIDDETCCASTEVCVCRITELFDVSMPTISHHLKLLREADLVDTRREGVWIYYSLKRDNLGQLTAMLDDIAEKAAARA